MTALFTLGSLQVTPYSLLMLAGALCGVGLTLLVTRGRKELRPALPLVLLLALLLGHAFWCVFNDGMLEEQGGALLAALQPWIGGYTLYGALFGGLLGALLASLICRVKLAELLDALTPGAALAICLGRLGEPFIGQGMGDLVEDERFCFFPLAWVAEEAEDYVEWSFAVWFWEALIALAILGILLLRARRSRPGEQTVVFLTALGTSQILMEQLRCDDYVRLFNEFVRFTQIAAMATLIGALVWLLIRGRAGWLRWLASFAALAGATLVVIYAEFVFDKPQFDFALRLSLGLTALASALLLILARGRGGLMAAGLQALMAAVLLGLHVFGDWNAIDPLLYGVIAYGAAVMASVIAVNLEAAPSAAGAPAET